MFGADDGEIFCVGVESRYLYLLHRERFFAYEVPSHKAVHRGAETKKKKEAERKKGNVKNTYVSGTCAETKAGLSTAAPTIQTPRFASISYFALFDDAGNHPSRAY